VARIDLYLKSIARFGATGAVFASGANVTLRFPAGDRYASQSTTHAELVSLVEEIVPPSLRASLRRGARTTFEHTFDGMPYAIEVEPMPGRWRVAVQPVPPPAPRELPMPPPPRRARPGAETREALPLPHPMELINGPPTRPSPRPPAVHAKAPSESLPPTADALPVPPGAFVPPASEAGGPAIHKLLVYTHEIGASDLHLTTGSPPMVRLHGEIKVVDGQPPLSEEALLRQLHEVTPERNRREFEEKSDTDFACTVSGVSRFRANLFRDRHGPGAVFRAIPFRLMTPEQLGLPRGVLDLCQLNKGLVVVTGPTGSGKSTTLATMIDVINETRRDHIITVEDPIEFLHESKKCLVHQREVHAHTHSFKDALRAALREDPDIVLVGEMRDLETIAIAVETAETGHLVFGTLHTTTAPSTVDRIIDQFPEGRRDQIRQMLAESLRGVIAQTLCRRVNGGRVAAYEVLMGSSAVSNLIREAKTYQLFSVMQTGRAQGMITLNDSLLELVRTGAIEPAEAVRKAVNKAELRGALAREGFKVPAAATDA